MFVPLVLTSICTRCRTNLFKKRALSTEPSVPSTKQIADGPPVLFAGLYIVQARSFDLDQVRFDKPPPVITEDILANPKKLHDFLTKTQMKLDSRPIYLIPIKYENIPQSDQTKVNSSELPSFLTIAIKSENPLLKISTIEDVKSTTMKELLSSTRLWDNELHWKKRKGKVTTLSNLDLELFNAIEMGSVVKAKEALVKGANVNMQRGEHGASALHTAVDYNELEIVQLLLRSGANPNINASNGATPLHWACQQGNLKIVEELVHAGADIHAVTNSWITDSVYGKSSGQTALHWAAEKGHVDIVLWLLKHGGISIAEDERGKTPEDLTQSEEVKQLVAENQKQKYVAIQFDSSSGFASEYNSFAGMWKQQQNKSS